MAERKRERERERERERNVAQLFQKKGKKNEGEPKQKRGEDKKDT